MENYREISTCIEQIEVILVLFVFEMMRGFSLSSCSFFFSLSCHDQGHSMNSNLSLKVINDAQWDQWWLTVFFRMKLTLKTKLVKLQHQKDSSSFFFLVSNVNQFVWISAWNNTNSMWSYSVPSWCWLVSINDIGNRMNRFFFSSKRFHFLTIYQKEENRCDKYLWHWQGFSFEMLDGDVEIVITNIMNWYRQEDIRLLDQHHNETIKVSNIRCSMM